MADRVVIIASGETERRALPHLLEGLSKRGVTVMEVRIPSQGRALDVYMAHKLIKASWWSRNYDPRSRPDKFVVLVDTDGKRPAEVTAPLREMLPDRLRAISAHIVVCHAQQHLEAWYFGDADRLRDYIGRALGSVDTSKPDDILNPKQHLKNLLGDRHYTAVVSEEIARTLNANTITGRSPSFRGFIEAVENGGAGVTRHSKAD